MANGYPTRYRATICLTSLVALFVSLYLHLWKIGRIGTLACAGGGCETVQTSRWASVLGIDVALIGALGYGAIFLVSLAGLEPRWRDASWPTAVLMILIYPAVLFTLWLKYAELVLLRSFCPWCLVSTVAIGLCAVMVTLDGRRLRARPGRAAPARVAL